MKIFKFNKTGFFTLLFVFLQVVFATAANKVKVTSPNGRIAVTFGLGADGTMNYAVNVDGKPVISPSAMGLQGGKDVCMDSGFKIRKVSRTTIDSVWTQPWGENKRIREHFNEMAVSLKNSQGVTLVTRFRVFNDGLGFRYEYNVPHVDSTFVMGESTTFAFTDDCQSWSIDVNRNSYELPYRELNLSKVKKANTPITMKTPSGLYLSLHEAALTDFAEMSLRNVGGHTFSSYLDPWPDGVRARFKGGVFKTPWRTLQVADSAVGLINSALILNLNEPCALADTKWIKPVKYIGIWWGMHLGIYTWTLGERHGATTENAKRYIDFAAANNIQGLVIEGWNDGWETWGNGEVFDYTKPYSDFNIKEVTRYAREKGIEIIGHHETGNNIVEYEKQLEGAYKWTADLGIHYVKTGYAGSRYTKNDSHHGQYSVRHYRKVVETAARNGIMLDVHEPIKDTGIRRTWPNMMTREGARGMEWNGWSSVIDPKHEVMLPFTRLLSGPMDYTPGIFNVTYENISKLPKRIKWHNFDDGKARVNTTLMRQVADWVILYSPLQMAADLIENYDGHPVFEFFRTFDADFDASEALMGEPGEYIVVQRRAKDKFFLGASTNEKARELSVPLSFLEPGVTYEATIYADGPDADWKTNPQSYRIENRRVNNGDTLKIRMASGGGQAVSFVPVH